MGTAFPFKGKEPCSFYHRRRRKNDAAVRDGRYFCVKNDQKVLVTTSTHIYRPPKEWHDQSLEAVERKFRTGRAAIIGSACRDPEKLSMPETELFEAACKKADLTLIEADGARHLPCKAPAEHEPALLSSSDLVIGVAGLSALGQPLGKGCFRAERAAELLGCTMEHHITEEDLARLIASEQGQQKDLKGRTFYAVLHQYEKKNTGRPQRNLWSAAAQAGDRACSGYVRDTKQKTKAVRTRIPGMGEQSFPCEAEEEWEPENKTEIERRRQMAEFTHFKKDGSVMVDVHEKPDTYRAASATGTIQVSPEVFAAVRDHTAKKRRCAWRCTAGRHHGGEEECGVDSAVPHCAADELRSDIYHGREYKFYYGRVHHIMCRKDRRGDGGADWCFHSAAHDLRYVQGDDRGMVIRDIHILEKDGGKSGHYIYQKEEK